MLKIQDHKSLIGKTKDEVLKELGCECNYRPLNIWTYLLKRNWIGKKQFLILNFENNRVVNIKTQSSFRKI